MLVQIVAFSIFTSMMTLRSPPPTLELFTALQGICLFYFAVVKTMFPLVLLSLWGAANFTQVVGLTSSAFGVAGMAGPLLTLITIQRKSTDGGETASMAALVALAVVQAVALVCLVVAVRLLRPHSGSGGGVSTRSQTQSTWDR